MPLDFSFTSVGDAMLGKVSETLFGHPFRDAQQIRHTREMLEETRQLLEEARKHLAESSPEQPSPKL